MSEDSDEDMDSDVTVEEEQEDEAGVDAFSDGNDVAAFSDVADAQDDLKVDIGNVDIAGGQQYSYSRLYDKDGYVRYAIGTYPANGSSLTLKVGDKRGMMYHALYTPNIQTIKKLAGQKSVVIIAVRFIVLNGPAMMKALQRLFQAPVMVHILQVCGFKVSVKVQQQSDLHLYQVRHTKIK